MSNLTKQNVYGYGIVYKDQIDLLTKVLKIHSLVTNLKIEESYLRPKLAEVLSFYMLLGYSKETKNVIIESLKITLQNLNQINAELTKKKYLVRDNNNFRKKHLSKELNEFKEFFLSNDLSKILLIKLTKDK